MFDRLRKALRGEASAVNAAPAPTLALPDYYGDAFTVLQESLTWMKEPVFSHPVTGEAATTLYALNIVLALGRNRDNWPDYLAKVNMVAPKGAVFLRTDLPKKNKDVPTTCISLPQAEAILRAAYPKLAAEAYDILRAKNGLPAWDPTNALAWAPPEKKRRPKVKKSTQAAPAWNPPSRYRRVDRPNTPF